MFLSGLFLCHVWRAVISFNALYVSMADMDLSFRQLSHFSTLLPHFLVAFIRICEFPACYLKVQIKQLTKNNFKTNLPPLDCADGRNCL